MSIATVEISVPGSVPSSVEIDGGFGPDVVEINQGPAGPNTVTTSTTTNITGLLKGNGSTVLAATAGTDYLTTTGNGSGLTGIVSSQITDASSAWTTSADDGKVAKFGLDGRLEPFFIFSTWARAENEQTWGPTCAFQYLDPAAASNHRTALELGTLATQSDITSSQVSDASSGAVDESVVNVLAKFGPNGELSAANFNAASVSVFPNGTLGLASTNSGGVVRLNGQNATDFRSISFLDETGNVALTPLVKSANFTALNGASYIATATLTVTDPTPAEGQGFAVLVRNGTTTVGGAAFATAGTVIRRVYHSGAWQNYIYLNSTQFSTLATTTPGTGVATFLATPTSANLAAAVTDETGTGSLVFGTSPTLTTPTISRGSVGQVFVAQDNNSTTCNFTTDSSGRAIFNINGKSGAASQAGGYCYINGFEETWVFLNTLSNTSGQRQMRFGNLTNRFSIQRLNDAASSITATPFSFANNAPDSSFYMLSSGGVGLGTTSDPGAGGIQTNGKIIAGNTVRLKGYTFATLPAGTQGDKAFISDGAALPVFRANAAGGGSTVTEVFFNGTNWINS
jgi:hypothetical protein